MARLSEPIIVNSPPNCGASWWGDVWDAWQASKAGLVDEALRFYRKADSSLNGYCLNPELSILRHNSGKGGGTVKPVPPAETGIVSTFLPYRVDQWGKDGKHLVGIPTEERMDISAEPISDRQHVMVLSTGRCGTVSLFNLFQSSNLEPYHTYWWMQSPYTRFEFQCRLAAGNHDDRSARDEWISTRKAEWLGEKSVIALNHSDTVYAPLFAKLHPKAKFIYLHRDSFDVFCSFYKKEQWLGGGNHFCPVLYDFEENRFSFPYVSEVDAIIWHIQYTKAFCRIFNEMVGDRFIEISADRLFRQDKEEISKLLEFTNSDIDLDFAVNHFSSKINEKAHKCLC